MQIIAVSQDMSDLNTLWNSLRELFPTAEINGFTDPLMAFKFSTQNPVDALYTETDMRRLDGFGLANMLLSECGPIEVNFISDSIAHREKAMCFHACGYFVKPITTAKLRRAMR